MSITFSYRPVELDEAIELHGVLINKKGSNMKETLGK
jgi:hypothetical protein